MSRTRLVSLSAYKANGSGKIVHQWYENIRAIKTLRNCQKANWVELVLDQFIWSRVHMVPRILIP